MEAPKTTSTIQAVPVNLTSFSGGQRDRDHPSLLQDNEYARCVNGEIRDAGLFKTRRGRTKKCDHSPGSNPQGSCYYEPTSGTAYIIQVNSGRVWNWQYGGSTWNRIDASVTLTNTTSDVGLIILNGRLYIFAGALDHVYSWDGISATLTDEGDTNTDPIKGSIVCQQAGRICASVITTDYIYFSDVFDGQTWDRSGNNKRVPTNGSEPVTSLAEYRKEEILSFTRNSCHIWNVSGSAVGNFTRTTLDPKVGTIAHKSVVVISDDAFFLDPTCHVRTIHRTQYDIAFGVSIPISYSNSTLFGRINKTYASKAAGVHFDNYYLLAVPLDANTRNSSVIPFDMLHQKATKEGTVPACVGEWTNMHVHSWIIGNFNGVQQLYYIDSDDGKLYLMFDGESDDGESIEDALDTKAYDWGMPNHDKSIHSGEVQYIDSTGSLTIYYAKADASFSTLGSMTADNSDPHLPVALPFNLGTGGKTEARCITGYRLGRSRYWQVRIVHTSGILNLKLITLRAWIESMATR